MMAVMVVSRRNTACSNAKGGDGDDDDDGDSIAMKFCYLIPLVEFEVVQHLTRHS